MKKVCKKDFIANYFIKWIKFNLNNIKNLATIEFFFIFLLFTRKKNNFY